MASLDSLPADQKAVLSLVLQRGRSFEQISAMLAIDRAAVRSRVLEGFDAMGPETSVEPLKRGLITDYLLGQLPTAVSDQVFRSLAKNPPERAWARVIAAEIAPLAKNGLPEIPAPGASPPARAPRTTSAADVAPAAAAPAAPAKPKAKPEKVKPAKAPRAKRAAAQSAAPEAPPDVEDVPVLTPAPPAVASGAVAPISPAAARSEARTSAETEDAAALPPSSRRGGAILLGVIAIVIIIVVVVLLATGGTSKTTSKTTSTTAKAPTLTSTTGTGTTGTATTAATPLHQINLVSPTSVKGREGAADVVRSNGVLGLVLVAEGLTANKKNAYGVWLYDTSTGSGKFLGFYNNQVTATGKTKGELEAEVKVPAGATKYNELLLTLETSEKPTKPGMVVLEGTFAE